MSSAALPRRQSPDPRQLQRCLLLAVLLHVWLVLMFGNAAGTAAPGQGVWGSLTVKLLGRSGGDASAPPAEPAAPGAGSPQRPTGTTPGAAEVGRFNPQEVPPETARTDEASPAPPSTATLDLPEGFRPIERQDLSPPPRSAPLQVPTPELPTAALGRLEARPDAVAPLQPAANLRTPSRPAELPPVATDLPAPVNRLEAAPATPAATTLPRPADLRMLPAPTAALAPGAELPAPVRRLEAPAAIGAATPLPLPAELRATTAATPSLTPATALPSPVQRLEAPTAEGGGAVTPLARSSELRATTPAATANALQGAQDLPAAVRRLESAEGGSAVAPLQPAPSARAAAATPGGATLSELTGTLPGQVNAPAGPARGDPTANPYAAPKASAGSPDAGSRLGPDLPAPPMPPTAAASAPSRAPLNLSLPRGDMTARRSLGAIDLIPPPPERKSKLEQSIEDATNKDCRKAYAGAGILAVVPLALDAARGKGCNW